MRHCLVFFSFFCPLLVLNILSPCIILALMPCCHASVLLEHRTSDSGALNGVVHDGENGGSDGEDGGCNEEDKGDNDEIDEAVRRMEEVMMRLTVEEGDEGRIGDDDG